MNRLLRRSELFIKRNASTILTTVGGVGVVVTAVMAVKATPKALKLLEEAKEEKGEKLTTFETIQVAGPAYIPSALVGAGTIACIFGANALNKRQQASLISAYALLDNSYKEYRNKVKELHGEEGHREIIKEIAKDKYEDAGALQTENKKLFYDDFSGRYFEATTEDVLRAAYTLNQRITVNGYACLNEFYDMLDVPKVPGGDEIGWSSFGLVEMCWYAWVEFCVEKTTTDDGRECHLLFMAIEPCAEFLDEDYC